MAIFNNIINVLKENSFYFYTIIGAAVILVCLIVAMIIVKVVRNKNELTQDERFIKATLEEEAKELEELKAKENGEEAQEAPSKKKKASKKPVKEEVKEEAEVKPLVLEEKPESLEEEPQEEPKEMSPVVEEKASEEVKEEEINEGIFALPLEEEKASKPKKKSRKKKVTEEVKEEVKVEETKLEETKSEEVLKPETEEVKVEEVSNEEALKEAEEVLPEKEETEETKKRVLLGKYIVFYDGTNYFYVLKASNGEVLIKSEIYSSRDTVLQAIDSIKRNVKVGRIEIVPDKHGLYQFALIARNNRKLVLSSNYKTEQRARSAANSFKRFAANSPIIESQEKVLHTQEEIEIDRTSKKGGRLGVLTTDNGGFYYLLKASNGEILVRSIIYKSKDSAERALKRFKDACNDGKFVVDRDKKGLYQFKLFSKANRVVVTGETYTTKDQAISSANSAYSFVELATDFDSEDIE